MPPGEVLAGPGGTATTRPRTFRLSETPSAGAARPTFLTTTWPVVGLAACIYLLVACLLYWPVPPWSNSRVLLSGNVDPAQTVWYLRWFAWAIAHGHNPLFSNYVDYPNGANIATNTSVPLLSTLSAPITWLFGSITTDNVLMRLGLAGSAFTMFLVLRRWVRWAPAAIIGGALFGFNSFTLQQSRTHLHLVFLVLPPLILWALDELFVSQRRHPALIGAALGLLGAAQWLINQEVLFGCAMFAVIGLVILALAQRQQVRPRLRRALPGIVTALLVLGVLVAYPAWFLLAGPRHLVGPTQPSWIIAGYRQDLLGPFVPHITEITRASAAVIAQHHPPKATFSWVSVSGYLGVPLVLLLLGLAVVWRRNRIVQFWALMAAVAFLLALGGRLIVLGHNTGIPLPAAVFAHVPLLYEIVPERLTIFMWLFLAIVLGVGLDCTYRWWRQGRRRRHSIWARTAGVSLALAVAIGTFVPMLVEAPARTSGHVFESSPATAIPSHTPHGGLVLLLPEIRSFAAQPMVWQAEGNMAYRMMSGYVIIPFNSYTSRNFPPPHGSLAKVMSAVPTERPNTPPTNHPTQQNAIAACKALPQALNQYPVDSIVIWSPPHTTTKYGIMAMTAALGPVPVRRDGLYLWDHVRQRERGTKACKALSKS